VTIDNLPDLVLLGIFDFYMGEDPDDEGIEAWHTLVHVCRNWRNVVFGSPRRLNLQLYCTARTPVKQTLDVWPLLPIVVKVYTIDKWDNGNIIAALEHHDRISELVIFDIPSSETERALAALQKPFPALTYLQFEFETELAPVLPASFLGGSAPALQSLFLERIPFPGLPKLLLSATHLVDLDIVRIPRSGYISPEAMVTGLSGLTRLESLGIGFESPRSRTDQRTRHLPPPTRTLLPVLTLLWFKGVSEYLEDLVAPIDAPRLDKLHITFFYQQTFHSPQLTQFISRTPKFKAQDEAHVTFSSDGGLVVLPRTVTYDRVLELRILCWEPDWQLSSVTQICSLAFLGALMRTVERLCIRSHCYWRDDVENSQWLELFRPYTAVKVLYIPKKLVPRIVPALKELVGVRVTKVLPALQSLFFGGPALSGPVREAMGQFVAAREIVGHPVVFSPWKGEY
jgi:hypothetical protein